MKRCLVLDLEMSALTPEVGEIVRLRAENITDPYDVFDEWVKPCRPLSMYAERLIGITNERLANCRSIAAVLPDFLNFIQGTEIIGDRLDFELAFLRAAASALGHVLNPMHI